MTLQAWKERAPRLVEECAELWSLRLGDPYEYAYVSLALRAELPDGTPAVLKVGWPHPESEHEADALAHYDGRGAVRLLAHDPDRNAMLLERCEPGTALLELDEEEALRVAAGVLRRLWRPPAQGHPFELLADVATRWASELPGLDPGLVRELVSSQAELVVCHQDFHGGNVLRAQSPGWRSTRSRSSASASSTLPRSYATVGRSRTRRCSGAGSTCCRRSSALTASG